MRRRTLTAGAALRDHAANAPETAATITVTLDSTFIRSCEDGERHLEVRVGNVETESGGRQVFGAVAGSDTDIKVLIGRNLDAVGRTEGSALTAFTDGCPGLRRILADAGVAELPILDWFHIGMRLQHLKQIATALSADDPAQVAAKTGPRESCGPPCRRWMVISLARAAGWSITPNAIVPDCELELRSPKGPPISW